jgi:peptide/nickel transport system permease protein
MTVPGIDALPPPPPLAEAPASLEDSALRGLWRHVVRSPKGFVGLSIVVVWVLTAIFAPLLAPYGAGAIVGDPLGGPTGSFLLGTDSLGRDILSRVIWGSRSVLVLAPLAVLIAEIVGAAIGLLAGYVGGVVDEFVMRVNDALLSFPAILLYLLIIAALGASPANVVIAIAAGSVPGIARIVRSVVVDLRARSYIAAARLRGERLWYVMAVELLPNARGPILVDATVRVGYAAFAIGTLGFLGLGTPPPNPDWGGMVNDGVRWLSVSAWGAVVPALALISLVIGLNLLAERLDEEVR